MFVSVAAILLCLMLLRKQPGVLRYTWIEFLQRVFGQLDPDERFGFFERLRYGPFFGLLFLEPVALVG